MYMHILCTYYERCDVPQYSPSIVLPRERGRTERLGYVSESKGQRIVSQFRV